MYWLTHRYIPIPDEITKRIENGEEVYYTTVQEVEFYWVKLSKEECAFNVLKGGTLPKKHHAKVVDSYWKDEEDRPVPKGLIKL